ncbi:chymotrypsin-1-like [Temnothorax nylanderi]|uniref:chymotrypsin-1-like n=1 Tax=Temnothorax nylanderi TaxID=102681 RepID=UPI003A88D450
MLSSKIEDSMKNADGTMLRAEKHRVRFKDELYNLKAHVGTNFLNKSGDVYDIESVSIHKDYILGGLIRLYDIALIHLETPINYNELVQPINLMTSDKNLEGKSCTLSEWDYTKNDEEVSNNLQEIELRVYPQEKVIIMILEAL